MRTLLIAGVIFLVCLCEARAQTAETQPGWHGTLGAGPVVVPRYLGSDKLQPLPLPIAFVDYNEWLYVRLYRAGAYLWSSERKDVAIGLAVEPRLGFGSGDGPRVAGMGTRRGGLSAGPAVDWEGDLGALSVGYFADLSGASNGSYLDIMYTRDLVSNERWSVAGAIEATRLDAKTVNYYFGVRPAEVTASRPLYQPGSTTNVTLWIMGQYNITARYALMFGGNVTRLGAAASASPIVERRQAPLLYLGLGLQF